MKCKECQPTRIEKTLVDHKTSSFIGYNADIQAREFVKKLEEHPDVYRHIRYKTKQGPYGEPEIEVSYEVHSKKLGESRESADG